MFVYLIFVCQQPIRKYFNNKKFPIYGIKCGFYFRIYGTYTHTVSPKGSVAVDPVEQVARVEETVNFTCSSLGGPEATYQWSKNGSVLEGENSTLLVISNVSTSSGGNYTCNASNPAGYDTASGTLYVHPFFTLQPADALSRINVNLTLTCEAEGFPSPAVHWEDSEGMLVSSSALLELAPVMFGDYYCVAETTVTVGSDTMTLTALSMNATLTGKECTYVAHGLNTRVVQCDLALNVYMYVCTKVCITGVIMYVASGGYTYVDQCG